MPPEKQMDGFRFITPTGRIGKRTFAFRYISAKILIVGSLVGLFMLDTDSLFTLRIFVLLAALWLNLCAVAKRMHDCNRSFFESIKVTTFFLTHEEGTPGRNEYGDPDNG